MEDEMKNKYKLISIITCLVLIFLLSACASQEATGPVVEANEGDTSEVVQEEVVEEVAEPLPLVNVVIMSGPEEDVMKKVAEYYNYFTCKTV